MVKNIAVILILLLLFSGCERRQGEKPMEDTVNTLSPEAVETIIPTKTAAPEQTLPAEPELLTVLVDPQEEDFVRVKDYIPGVAVELKYSTRDNFTGQVIYGFEDVFLRYGTVMKLKAVSEELTELGYGLKIWDGFRPVSAQFRLWKICPDPTYVADPNNGFSNHSRGYAVDLTLVDLGGREVEMPTDFDDFSPRADRDYSDCTETAAENVRLLEAVMEKHGFQGYWGEWWHFNDTRKYDVETCFDPGVISRRYTGETVPLLKAFHETDSVVLQIPAGEAVTLLGFAEEYSLVEFWGYRGYVPTASLQAEQK